MTNIESADSSLVVVLFGTYDESMHPRVAVLRQAMEAAGHDVRVCNEPLGLSTANRVRLLRQPWRLVPSIAKVGATWISLFRKARAIDRKGVDVVVVGYLGVIDVHLAKVFFRAPVVLDNMAPVGDIARDRGLPFARVLDVLDWAAMRASDVVVADTVEHLPPRSAEAAVVSVGAPTEWFDARKPVGDTHGAGTLSVCFFGLFTPLQGAGVIGEAIALLADKTNISWTLVGTGQDRTHVEELVGHNPAVTWIDWVSGGELPELVAGHDVCLGIFGTTPKAMRVVPNKVFQGAAAGCAVVTSDTTPQRSALGEGAIYVAAGDASELAQTIDNLCDEAALAQARQAASLRADSYFSPSALAAQVDGVLRRAIA